MPTTLKKLYLGKSMGDLVSHAKVDSNVQKLKTDKLMQSITKLFDTAELSYREMDEERAYVLYSRCIEMILLFRKRSDAKPQDKEKLHKYASTAIAKAETLKDSLLIRYSICEEADCRARYQINSFVSEQNNNVINERVPQPVVPVAESPKVEEIELSISCTKLRSLLTTNHSSIILMDIRPASDFDESHIKHSHCINIPEEILTPGVTAARLESMLPVSSMREWYNRGKADHVVIIDWESKDETTASKQIDTLKQAMSKWDQNCVLKKTPMVLQGGYKDWMLKYPMYTTKALNFISLSETKPSAAQTDILDIEYPNLDEPEKKSINNKGDNLGEPDVLFVKSTNRVVNGASDLGSNNSRKLNSAPTVDRKSKPNLDRGAKSSIGDRKSDSNLPSTQTFHNGRPPLSLVNNTDPHDNQQPAAKRKGTEEEAESRLMNLLSSESSLAQSNLELAQQQLQKEEEFAKLRLRKELEAEESMRAELQKREELLVESLKKMELEMREKDRVYAKIKQENLKMKKMVEENNLKNEEKISQKEKEREIIEAERKKKATLESIARLREERKRKEEIMRKKNEFPTKPDAIPRDTLSANSSMKRNLSQDQNNTTSQASEYTVRLSREDSTDGGGRGMVRSHSSPNIAQMVNQEESSPQHKITVTPIPSVDRSLKPKNQQIELNRARLRNLNPVYGTSVAPATGLKNLGNTCFMNSVIQCLSNTLLLADYFLHGYYVSDINRNAKSGSGGEVAEEFAVVIGALWMGQYKSFSPKDFKNTVSRCLAVCIGNEQQDSHEFLVVLMEKLHSDLKKKHNKPFTKLESCSDEEKFWDHHLNFNYSMISNIFEGLLKSTLTCLSCRTTSDSFEVFSCLSLPILSNRCSLQDCFQHFLKSEKISGEAAWDCPKCKQKKEAEKRLRICRVPKVLIIQLKRFSYEGLWRRKLQTTVDFDLFCNVPYETKSEARYHGYSLYGVVNHFGTLEGGHYTAYCKTKTQKWFKYDDQEVSEISSSDIKTSAAYLLFYQANDSSSNL